MGRPRKILDEQQGNLTTVEKARKQAEEEMSKGSQDRIERPPTWLKNPVAKKEYKTIIKDLKKAPSFLLCDLDINNLAAYCNAYAQYRRVTALIDDLAEDELTVQTKKRREAESTDQLADNLQHRDAALCICMWADT